MYAKLSILIHFDGREDFCNVASICKLRLKERKEKEKVLCVRDCKNNTERRSASSRFCILIAK